jgi:hypothetical protein
MQASAGSEPARRAGFTLREIPNQRRKESKIMRKTSKLIAIATVSAAAMLTTATPVLAATATAPTRSAPVTYAKIIGNIHMKSATTAVVRARYSCVGSVEQRHLWVSLKQTADRTANPALATEGSGSQMIAAAWSQSHAGVLTCDGKRHTGAFTVDQTEQGFGTLARGAGYVQFCLFDANYTDAPYSVMQFRHVTDH